MHYILSSSSYSFFYHIRVSRNIDSMLIQVDQFLEIYPELWIGSTMWKDPPWFTRSKIFRFRRKFPLQRFYFVLGFLHSFPLNDLPFRVGLLLSATILIAFLRYAQLNTFPISLSFTASCNGIFSPNFNALRYIRYQSSYVDCEDNTAEEYYVRGLPRSTRKRVISTSSCQPRLRLTSSKGGGGLRASREVDPEAIIQGLIPG